MNPKTCALLSFSIALTVAWTLPVSQPALAFQTERPSAKESPKQDESIDFRRARELRRKRQSGEKLTSAEDDYLNRALEARRRQPAGDDRRALPPGETTGFKPLQEMSAEDRYQNQDGGLYGQGMNQPPQKHQEAAMRELAKIEPLNAAGQPAADGRIVLVSISMSNATQEFSRFKNLADADRKKSPKLTIVDCAQGGQAMAEWVPIDGRPWLEAARRLDRTGVTAEQVQIAWIKLANKNPRGDLETHGRKLQQDTLAVIKNAKAKFPNLRIAYLSSRIYGGYSASPLNPEPYAYESGFVVRWLIQDQISGHKDLRFEGGKNGEKAKAPLLLWGPYLWADGVTPRKNDGLAYARDDLAKDGTHPSPAGREKVARLILNFFKEDPLAKPWFVGPLK